MPRIRLYDVRTDRLPELLGQCQSNIATLCRYINSAERRLLLCREAGDEGWYGTFAEVQFNFISRLTPYITTPRQIARIESINVCNRTVPLNNQFVEYLDFGNGRMPRFPRYADWAYFPEAYTRNNVPVFVDLPAKGMFLRCYSTSPLDYSTTRVLLQGTDSTDTPIYTIDNNNQVSGQFLTLQTPFVQTPQVFNSITGVQKDITIGYVQIFAVDPTTGAQTLLSVMEPGETVAGYRRYYLNNLPCNCCHTPGVGDQNLMVTAIVKLEAIPVAVDTDYLLFHNMEAVIEEACSVRYSEMDNPTAKQMAQEKHLQAVRLLNGELTHYYGKDKPAVLFAPFGSARLERINIGMI